jgi:UMF1 family MFS transporter
MTPIHRREIVGWSLYDFANSAFSTLIVTWIFNLYFVEFVVGDPIRGTILWTRAVNISAITVALFMPFLGAIADHSGRKKRFLFLFTALSVACTVLLFFSKPGDVMFAAAVFVVANVAGEGAQVFYNGFLPELSTRKTMGRISGFAWGLGYFGGLLSLLLGLAIFRGVIPVPETDYLNIRASALLVAAWFGFFSIPLFLWVRERAERRSATAGEYAAIGFRRVRETVRELGTFREAAKLLLARMIYNDGLVTVIAMAAIYVGAVYGMPFDQVILMGIVLNVAAGLGAWALGFVDDRIGGKRTVLITLVVLTFATVLGTLVDSLAAFWVAAVLIGLMMGPNQSASRSLLSRFVPGNKQAEFFGFFAFSGKISSVAGPFAYGTLLSLTGNHRIAMGSIAVFFVAGLLVLLTVNEEEGILAADAYEALAEA